MHGWNRFWDREWKMGESRENGHRPVECAPTERKREVVVINRTFIAVLGKAGAGVLSQNGSLFIAIDVIKKAEGDGLVEFF